MMAVNPKDTSSGAPEPSVVLESVDSKAESSKSEAKDELGSETTTSNAKVSSEPDAKESDPKTEEQKTEIKGENAGTESEPAKQVSDGDKEPKTDAPKDGAKEDADTAKQLPQVDAPEEKKDVDKKDEDKKDENKKDEDKKDEDKKDATKIDEDKKDETKKDETKKDEDKKDAEKKDEDKKKEEEPTWEEKRAKVPKIAGVRWLNNFERFKNRYSEDEGLEIIEVLRANQHTIREVVEERNRRKGWKKRINSEEDGGADNADSEGTWIQRVRIQSAPLLFLLSRISGHGSGWNTDTPRTFFRPFRAFYYYQPRMKESLRVLKLKLAELERKEATSKDEAKEGTEAKKDEEKDKDAKSDDVKTPEATKPDEPEEEDSDDEDAYKDIEEDEELIPGVSVDLEDIPQPSTKETKKDESKDKDKESAAPATIGDIATAVKHLRCYVKFVDEHIMPMYKHFAGTTQRKVRFYDLWMSFLSGEILYVPSASDSSKSQNNATDDNTINHQTTWRLCNMDYTSFDDGPSDILEKGERGVLELHAYHIDFNGTSYGPVQKTFKIQSYEGEKEIEKLKVYPLRFAKNAETIRKELEDQGKLFQSRVKEKHLSYEGWTLTHTGDGDQEHKTPEHVEGDVIIDFVEGFKANPALKPSFDSPPRFDDKDWPSGDDRLPIKHWSDAMRTKTVGQIKEKAQTNEWFGGYLEKRHRKTNKFIKEWDDGKVTELEGDNLILLPRRMMAYALRERRFVMIDINFLRPVVTQDNVFRDLKIDENHKRMVKSLVKSHFKKQVFQKNLPPATEQLNQDLIRGKGSGLVVLLHGVPGVGKTATAEAVAQANKKPLFVITCGDLGFTPSTVESALKDIFRLAHLWECVLLLDEADIFLSRRETSDLKRNALVSVFLRVLEYYSGILFLTTNRVGTLDEAFKSRIHISLYYYPLSMNQTLAIFDLNIKKLRAIEDAKQKQAAASGQTRAALQIDTDSIMDFAKWHYSHSEQRWNGRQIRNAFQIASSLADFDLGKTSLESWDDDEDVEKDDSKPEPVLNLDYRQFQVVADAIEEFDQYLIEANAGNDEDTARNLGIRADDFDPRQTPTNRARYLPPRPPRSGAPSGYLRPARRNSDRVPPRSPSRERPYDSGPPSRGGRRGPPPSQRGRGGGDRFEPRPKYRPPPLGQTAASPARGGSLAPRSPGPRPPRASPHPPPSRRGQAQGGTPSRRPPRQDDSGYSGWSTTPDPSLAPEERYSHDEAYDERYEEGEYDEEYDDDYRGEEQY